MLALSGIAGLVLAERWYRAWETADSLTSAALLAGQSQLEADVRILEMALEMAQLEVRRSRTRGESFHQLQRTLLEIAQKTNGLVQAMFVTPPGSTHFAPSDEQALGIQDLAGSPALTQSWTRGPNDTFNTPGAFAYGRPSDIVIATRQIVGQEGRPDGLLALVVRRKQVATNFKRALAGFPQHLLLVSQRGFVYLQSGRPARDLVGADLSGTALFQRIRTGEASFILKEPDGLRLYASMPLWDKAMWLVASTGEKEILAPWWRTVSLAAGLLAGAGVMGALLVRALVSERKRTRALEARFAELSPVDGLTGLGSRRELNARLDEAWQRCARCNECLALLLVDIDRFTRLIQRHGMLESEAVLKGVGQILSASLAGSDAAARVDGDAFAIVLPNTNTSAALEVAARIRFAVEAGRFGTQGGISVSVSVGVGTVRPAEPGTSIDDLMRHACAGLLRARAGETGIGLAA